MKTKTAAMLIALSLLAAGCGGRGGEFGDDAMGMGAGYSGADGMGMGGLGSVSSGGLGTAGMATSFLPGTTISDRVLFSVDQWSLSPEATAILDQQVGWLQQNPGAPINIEGHADERGTRDYNIALSARRASAVRNYMVARGVPDARISTTPYGRERPAATCPDESCWAQNRRAVTVVTGGAGV